jgi:hypothetical protein
MLRSEPFDRVLLNSSIVLDPTAIATDIRADPIPRRLPVFVLTEPTDHEQPGLGLRQLVVNDP